MIANNAVRPVATAFGGILRDGRLAIAGAAVAVISILLGFPLVKKTGA